MIYIIDGYNVMHYREAGDIPAGVLERKRQEFTEEVVSFVASTGDEAVIVFDSRRAKAPECHPVPASSVTVCFASASMSADILIGRLVKERLAQGEPAIRVVSADWEVQVGAMQERVERVPPRNFLSEQKKFAKKLAKNPENDRIRWKLEHKVDIETLRKLEKLRRGNGDKSEDY